MKILVTGAAGQLGSELMDRGTRGGFRMFPVDLPQFDITRLSHVERVFSETPPDLVVNAAAYTAVDRAESDSEGAFAVNRDGPAIVAGICAAANIPMIHISTDYVFDGTKGEAYLESDPVSPLGIYGKSKETGERLVRQVLDRHLIIRTAWLYGSYGHNFVKTMLRLGTEREEISVVADQYGSPTSASDLAAAILTIASRLESGSPVAWGTYHYTGAGVTSWHGFAVKIFAIAATFRSLKVKSVRPITTSEYPQQAPRPTLSALDCAKIRAAFGLEVRPWPESLKETLLRLSDHV